MTYILEKAERKENIRLFSSYTIKEYITAGGGGGTSVNWIAIGEWAPSIDDELRKSVVEYSHLKMSD